MSKKVFLFIVALFFSVHAILDFLRMMFGWSVEVAGAEIPTWVSGLLFIFSIFIVYWCFIISREEESGSEKEEEKEEEDDEQTY